MYTNTNLTVNTIICSARKVGYHPTKYLIFNQVWEYSIDFYFEIQYMHASDLYLILFSYLRNMQLFCLDVYTLAQNKSKFKFFSKKTGFEMSRMTYREFESWWNDRQWYDSSLLETKEIYGIRISFIPKLVNNFIKNNNITLEDFYVSYKPAYPWCDSVISIFDSFIDHSNEHIFWEKPLKYEYDKKPTKY